MEFTVLTFIKIQFLKKWNRSHSAAELLALYTPLGTAELLVVTRSPAGTEVTYIFKLTGEKQQVWVSTQENIVQIPGICIAKKDGDQANCVGK
jgi:hypothetical protein